MKLLLINSILGFGSTGHIALDIANEYEQSRKAYENKEYLSSPEVQKVIAKRKEQPKLALDNKKLDYASNCVKAFSDNGKLQEERCLQAERIAQKRATIGKKYLRDNNITKSELSGKEFNGGAQVHYIERISDRPEKAFDQDNMIALTQKEHEGPIRRQNCPVKKALQSIVMSFRKMMM